jgi:O-acetyl-ADP-ribose deacetylase (regulator of RNase III)
VIQLVTGDILLSDAQVIAHGVAPHDHFNQGLALALHKQYPAMAKDFRHYCQVAGPKPGEVWAWAGDDGRRVVCLMTQEPAKSKNGHPGAASTHNVNVALRNLAALCREEGFESLALPRLATGVGSLNWDEVLPLIEQHLGDLGVPVQVFDTYRPKQAPEPS